MRNQVITLEGPRASEVAPTPEVAQYYSTNIPVQCRGASRLSPGANIDFAEHPMLHSPSHVVV